MMTEGWFLSRCAMRMIRSSIACVQVGSFDRLRRYTCDSMFASSSTYMPSRSQTS